MRRSKLLLPNLLQKPLFEEFMQPKKTMRYPQLVNSTHNKQFPPRQLLITYWFYQVSKLQDDNKALDRLSKSKEAALLEAERSVEIAMSKASLVDDLQNKNQELMKQIEICQVRLYG